MGYGRTCPAGSLPAYSVADEREARELIVLACPTDVAGRHFAPELAHHQSVEGLARFAWRLARAHEVLAWTGRCRCPKE